MKIGEVTGSVMLSQESNLFIVRVNRVLQIVFSLFVFCSALLCFSLEKDWFKNISASSKIPSYAMLSISISFTFIYGVIDFLQICLDHVYKPEKSTNFTKHISQQRNQSKSIQIIQTNLQLYLLLAVSFVLGIVFGAIFGIIDVEAYSKNQFTLYTVL